MAARKRATRKSGRLHNLCSKMQSVHSSEDKLDSTRNSAMPLNKYRFEMVG